MTLFTNDDAIDTRLIEPIRNALYLTKGESLKSISLPILLEDDVTETFDYDDFMHDANAAYIYHPEHQRYGQFLMNYLTQHHPDVNVPDEVDCFYNNDKVTNFMIFLCKLSDGT